MVSRKKTAVSGWCERFRLGWYATVRFDLRDEAGGFGAMLEVMLLYLRLDVGCPLLATRTQTGIIDGECGIVARPRCHYAM